MKMKQSLYLTFFCLVFIFIIYLFALEREGTLARNNKVLKIQIDSLQIKLNAVNYQISYLDSLNKEMNSTAIFKIDSLKLVVFQKDSLMRFFNNEFLDTLQFRLEHLSSEGLQNLINLQKR